MQRVLKMCHIHTLMLVGDSDKAGYGHSLMSIKDLVLLVQTPMKVPTPA